MAIKLAQEVFGQKVGETYAGPADALPWLEAEGYVYDDTNPTSHLNTTGVPPEDDPTLAVNREDPNGDEGWAAVDGVTGDHRDFQFGDDPATQKPQVYQITPNKGPAAGGTALVIKGDNFTSVTSVTIGGVATTAFSVVSDKEIRCTTGAHAAGAVNVVFDKTGTAGDATVTNGFTYTA